MSSPMADDATVEQHCLHVLGTCSLLRQLRACTLKSVLHLAQVLASMQAACVQLLHTVLCCLQEGRRRDPARGIQDHQ